MFKNFMWTKESEGRINLTMKYEPIQPFLFYKFSEMIGCQYVIDIGANIGAYSIINTSLPNLIEIHAFEADVAAYKVLKKNIKLNNAKSIVRPYQKVVSNFCGTLEFAISAPMAGINAVRETSFHRADKYSDSKFVDCLAIDDFFDLKEKRISLKIDVEGHEAKVLDGAKELLQSNSCMVQIETYKNEELLSSFFKSVGYKNFFSARHDLYFSNHKIFGDKSNIIEALESACAKMIDHNLQKR